MKQRTADPFSSFEHIRERMEQAYQRLVGAPGSPHFGVPVMEPPVDVYQTETDVVVQVEIAGISDEEVELEVEGNTLIVRGERKPLPGQPQRVYSQMEIAHGPFQRRLLLPAAVNAEAAVAVYKCGILEIVLPKASPTSGRQLRIVVH
jgi:HSP20 family protein